MRIIAVSNQRGASGKTTTAINLAACLAGHRKRVLLVDVVPRRHCGNASIGLNLKPYGLTKSVYDVLADPSNTGLDDIIVAIDDNFDLAPSSMKLSGAEMELVNQIGGETRLAHAISGLKRRYDYILIDCPPALGFLTFNSLVACDEILIAVEMSFFALQGVGKLLQFIDIIRERLDHSIVFYALATMYDGRNRICEKVLKNMRENFKEKLLNTVINVNVKLKEAASKGSHILDYDPKSKGARDYLALAGEIIAKKPLLKIPA